MSAENDSTPAPEAGGASTEGEKKDWDEEYYVQLYDDFCDDLESKAVYEKPDKRQEKSRIQWEEFHMLVAVLSSRRGDDPDRKVWLHEQYRIGPGMRAVYISDFNRIRVEI